MTKKTILGKDAFMNAASKLKRVLVELPELKGSVYVREMTGSQLLRYNEKVQSLQKENPELTPVASLELIALMVSFTVCDEAGNLLFTEEDVKSLAENSFGVLLKLSNEALRISGLGNAANEIQEQLKNAQTSSSTEN